MSLDPDRPAVRIRRRWLVITLALATSTKAAADAEGLAFFESRIRPALAEHSDRCHSGRTPRPKGGLRLDGREGSRKGGHSGPAVVPSRPDESPLIEAIERTGDSAPMPPDDKLPASVVADFRRWIERGATDPREPPSAAAETWWSLRPIARPDVPGGGGWARTPIDAFVLAKLREKGLTPSLEADRFSSAEASLTIARIS